MTHLVSINPLLFSPGDRMGRDEFLSRWDQMPGLKRAELIDGVVHTPSPLGIEHGRIDGLVETLVGYFILRTGDCWLASNATWLMAEKRSAAGPCVGSNGCAAEDAWQTRRGRAGSGGRGLCVEPVV